MRYAPVAWAQSRVAHALFSKSVKYFVTACLTITGTRSRFINDIIPFPIVNRFSSSLIMASGLGYFCHCSRMVIDVGHTE